jgi:predicted metallo-beta-lactamase superfamily hydrolase
MTILVSALGFESSKGLYYNKKVMLMKEKKQQQNKSPKKKHKKQKEQLSTKDIQELMGMNMPVYTRHNGAVRRK